MNPSKIPFIVPEKYKIPVSVGEVVRHGALLKDASTGRILAHVQEAGGLKHVVRMMQYFDPLSPLDSVTGIYNVIQGEQIKRKLDIMQGMLGALQMINIATLASSFVGIGTTLVTAKIILKRLERQDNKLTEIINMLGDTLRLDYPLLKEKLYIIITQSERLAEVLDNQRPEEQARRVVEDSEKTLDEVFEYVYQILNQCANDMRVCVKNKEANEALVKTLLANLALSGSLQFKALLWLDEKLAARSRARKQIEKLHELAKSMPRDELENRILGERCAAKQISRDAAEIRMRIGSLPALCDTLVQMSVRGRDYLEQLEEKHSNQPIVLLPTQ